MPIRYSIGISAAKFWINQVFNCVFWALGLYKRIREAFFFFIPSSYELIKGLIEKEGSKDIFHFNN